ncbi:MAG: leucine-rich repeat domain-containing protein, partial [Chloroflexi bacterium]|nr:leucine-rich repeat domain-containing protein [Chloroflexota bacterium]
MKRHLRLLAIIGLFFLSFSAPQGVAADVVVTFPDPGLEAAIRQGINKPAGDIYQSELQSLTYLDASMRNIANLAGLEYVTNLTTLNLGQNQISDISPLANLTNLTTLYLHSNQISNISPLDILTNLTQLRLDINQISNIAPLAFLTNLTHLWINSNQISNISPLASLTNLTTLYIYSNQISNISPLANLTNLDTLDLRYNQISDIAPLANLVNLITLVLDHNQISDISPLASLTKLYWLWLDINQISDVSSLASLTDLNWLRLRSNQISDISPLVANAGLATGDTVDLRSNPLSVTSLNTYIPQLVGRGVNVLYDAPYTLTMAVNGSGTTDPAVGAHTYAAGTVVNITATPDAGWQFVNWTGDVADPNAANTTVTMDADKTVTANFSLEPTDTTPPTVSITSPDQDAVVTTAVTVAVSASDNVGVTGVTVTVVLIPDNVVVGVGSASAPFSGNAQSGTWQVALTLTGLPDPGQALKFSATGTDAANNMGTDEVVVDNDGISAVIDMNPDAYSDDFSDIPLGGTTFGEIKHRGNHTVLITELPNPAGVSVSISGGQGPAWIDANGTDNASLERIRFSAAGQVAYIRGDPTYGTIPPGTEVQAVAGVTSADPIKVRKPPTGQLVAQELLTSPGQTVTVGSFTAGLGNTAPITVQVVQLVGEGENEVETVLGSGLLTAGQAIDIDFLPDGTIKLTNLGNTDITFTMFGTEMVIAAGQSVLVNTVSISLAVSGNGSTDPAVGDHIYPLGGTAVITATPDTGWQFNSWTGDVADTSANPTTVTMDADKTVTANFSEIAAPPTQYTLTMAKIGSGSISPAVGDHTYDEGTVVAVTANPAPGWEFAGWSGPVANPNAASTNVTMNSSVEVTANFSQITSYTLNTSVNGGGNVSPAAGTHTYTPGTMVNVTATPNAGWQFSYWTGAVANNFSASTTVTMDANKTVIATFMQTGIPVGG